jgi:hypothetical protein
MIWYRIRLDQVQSEAPDPIVITVPLDPTSRIALRMPFAGWWGTLKGNAWLRPVVFQPDGNVRFAQDPEDDRDECISEVQIFDRPLDLGASFYLKDLEDGEVSHFVVREKTELAN